MSRRGPKRQRRYPVEDLASILRREFRPDVSGQHRQRDASGNWIAERCGLSSARWHAAARGDGLTESMADRAAIHAGLHPAEVWPCWLDDVPTDELEAS